MEARKIEADVSWCPFTSLVVSLTFLSITQLFIYWLIFFFPLKMFLCSITDRLKCIFSKGITLSGGTLIGVMFIFDNPSGQDTSRTCPDGILDADAGRAVPSLPDCGEDGRQRGSLPPLLTRQRGSISGSDRSARLLGWVPLRAAACQLSLRVGFALWCAKPVKHIPDHTAKKKSGADLPHEEECPCF